MTWGVYHWLTDEEKAECRRLYHVNKWCIWDLMAKYHTTANEIESALRPA